MGKNYDAIIIGCGFAGMVAGCFTLQFREAGSHAR